MQGRKKETDEKEERNRAMRMRTKGEKEREERSKTKKGTKGIEGKGEQRKGRAEQDQSSIVRQKGGRTFVIRHSKEVF